VGLKRLKFFRNLRTTLYVLIAVVVLAVGFTLYYLNATGMPQSWRLALENELSKQGIEATISKLRYIPLRGIEASEVEIYTDPTRTRRMAHLERLIFDLDKTKALRGIIRLTHIELLNADLHLPINLEDPQSETLNVSNLNGKVLLSKSRKFEIKQGRGVIDGIHLTVDAVILGFRPVPGYKEEDESSGKHRRLMREFVKEISHWNLDPAQPPELNLKIEADATKWSSLKCQFVFSCKSASRDEIRLQDLRASGNIVNALVSVNHLTAHDERGKIDLTLDYDMNERAGNFDGLSTLDVPHWSYQLTGKRLLNDFALAESPTLKARGQFAFPPDQPMSLSMYGQIDSRNVLFRGSPLSALSCEFSFREQDFFLRNIKLTHDQGEMRGQVLQKNHQMQVQLSGMIPLNIVRPLYRDYPIASALAGLEAKGKPVIQASIDARLSKNETYTLDTLHVREIQMKHPLGTLDGNLQIVGNLIHYELDSTFPPEVWQPFFPNQPLEKILADFSTTSESRCHVKLKGGIDRSDKTAWTVNGEGKVENLSYKNVPVHSCSTSLDLNHDSLTFSNIAVDYNYSNYELQRAFQGGTHGPVQARSVIYQREAGLVQINGLTGNIYPVPLLNMFAKSIADSLTEYRFHTPPPLSADGSIDVRNEGRTKLKVSLKQAKAMTWEFLGSPVVFSNLSSEIDIDGQQVQLNRIDTSVFEGNCLGSVRVKHQGEKRFDADIRWNSLHMENLAETYAFKEKGYGTLTGRIALSGIVGNTKSLEGEGLCSLEKGELFAVPIFGPLSPVISGVLGDRRAGFERAKDAFCNFTIHKGVIETNDFSTHTTSLKFTGNGKVDLNDKTIDMTIRMNARGLLGIITWPLQPLIKGLFQFQGQGPVDQPEWEHVVFTSPPEKEKDALLRDTPMKAEVVPE
jgi:AsmA-like C-terminal region